MRIIVSSEPKLSQILPNHFFLRRKFLLLAETYNTIQLRKSIKQLQI